MQVHVGYMPVNSFVKIKIKSIKCPSNEIKRAKQNLQFLHV